MLIRIVLAVALVLGVAAVAQASSSRDDNGGNSGGYHIGPYGPMAGRFSAVLAHSLGATAPRSPRDEPWDVIASLLAGTSPG